MCDKQKCVDICKTKCAESACVVLLGLLRHQADIGSRAHRLDVELTVLLDVLAPAKGGGKENKDGFKVNKNQIFEDWDHAPLITSIMKMHPRSHSAQRKWNE